MRKTFPLLALALALTACQRAPSPPALGPADVSVLFPRGPELWPASLPTRGGPLLPRERFELNARSLSSAVDDALEYDALRVVALRFDPCFQRALGATCEPQLRLVLQPADNNGTHLHDGAVHAHYTLSPAAFGEALDQLIALTDTPAAGPLGVHPRLAREGINGPLGQGLQRIVQTHLGPATLSRVTFMTRTDSELGQWQFSGFELTGAQPTRLPIAGIDATMQNVTRSSRVTQGAFYYTVHPLFADRAGRRGASSAHLEGLTPADQADVHAWAMRQESPAHHVPDSTDCASCHLANHIGRHLEALAPERAPPRPARLIAGHERDADNLRAFGYFNTEPQIAQRTANETAAVLARLRRPRAEWHQP